MAKQVRWVAVYFKLNDRVAVIINITTHSEPILLRLTGNQAVYTDPNTTVAWSENLTPNIKTNLTFGSFIDRGSGGESFQLEFFGEGWVLVWPYEE